MDALPEHATVDDVFTDIHKRAFAVTSNIPVFEPGIHFDYPQGGDVYKHVDSYSVSGETKSLQESWVRVSLENGAPYLLHTLSIDQSGAMNQALPVELDTYKEGTAQFSMKRMANGLIEIGRGSYDDAGVMLTASIETTTQHNLLRRLTSLGNRIKGF